MKSKLCLLLASVIAVQANATTLWDNGSMITHPGAGPGGVDISRASHNPNSAGANTNGNFVENFAVAEDFTVGNSGWEVESITRFAYDIDAPGGIARWNAISMEIWKGDLENNTATLIATASSSAYGLTGINRIYNDGSLSDTSRQINTIQGSFFNVTLDEGHYWSVLAISPENSADAYSPYVMEPNAANPDDPTTVAGNALIRNSGVWHACDFGTPNVQVEFPMIISGQAVPEPASLSLLGLAAIAIVRKKRIS
jgi:hypothetical protein